MTNFLKALAAFALSKPNACNFGGWAKQKRLKASSTPYRMSDDQKMIVPTKLPAAKKPQEIRSIPTQSQFDVNCQYYNLLEVRPDATIQAIRSSYFRLAKKSHPDALAVEESAEVDQQFAKLTEAYHALCDPAIRREYDRFLIRTEKPKNVAEVSSKMAILLSDQILAEVSKTNKLVPKVKKAPAAGIIAMNQEKPEPEMEEISVPFMQAITGQIHHVNLRFSSSCPSCQKSNRRNCTICHGSGLIPIEKMVPIRIPWAVDNGQVLTVKHPMSGRENLKIRIKIEPHPHFVRDKLDIVSTAKIPWLVGLLGGQITVKNVYGDIIPVSIEAGTDSHTTIRLAGKGVKSTEATGDHLVIVKIVMPAKLSEQQKKILLQYF